MAPFRVGMAPHLSPLYVLLLMPQPAVVSHGKKVEYLFLNPILVRGHWHCPPPEKCCRARKIPINVFDKSLCYKKSISRWKLVELMMYNEKKMTAVEFNRLGSVPTSAQAVNFDRVLYLGSGST